MFHKKTPRTVVLNRKILTSCLVTTQKDYNAHYTAKASSPSIGVRVKAEIEKESNGAADGASGAGAMGAGVSVNQQAGVDLPWTDPDIGLHIDTMMKQIKKEFVDVIDFEPYEDTSQRKGVNKPSNISAFWGSQSSVKINRDLQSFAYPEAVSRETFTHGDLIMLACRTLIQAMEMKKFWVEAALHGQAEKKIQRRYLLKLRGEFAYCINLLLNHIHVVSNASDDVKEERLIKCENAATMANKAMNAMRDTTSPAAPGFAPGRDVAGAAVANVLKLCLLEWKELYARDVDRMCCEYWLSVRYLTTLMRFGAKLWLYENNVA